LLKPRQPYMLLAVSLSACCLMVSCCSSTGSLQAAGTHQTQQNSLSCMLHHMQQACCTPLFESRA
jgi:hypothetical protein